MTLLASITDVRFCTSANCPHCGGIGYVHICSPMDGGFRVTVRFCECARMIRVTPRPDPDTREESPLGAHLSLKGPHPEDVRDADAELQRLCPHGRLKTIPCDDCDQLALLHT